MNTLDDYRLGITAYSDGRYEQAIAHLTQVATGGKGARVTPGRFYLAQAHYRLAVRLFGDRRFADATRHFQAAARLNPDGLDYARFLAACHIQSGRFELAADELEAMLGRCPDDADIRIRLALTRWKQGHVTEAQATLREGLGRQPMQPELHYQLGVMLAAEEDYIEAEQLFSRTIAIEPSHAGAHERLAQCCALAGRHERALGYLQRAHQLEPASPRIALQLNLLAQAMASAGLPVSVEWRPAVRTLHDPDDIERLGEAILREPEFVEAFLSLPETSVDSEVFSTLAAVLERALQTHPEYADLHYHCGAVYRRLGHTAQALRHAERAVELNANYVSALILLADLYGRTDRWVAGVQRLEQAIRAGANYPDVHYLMGRLCQSGGELDRARQAYQRALELNRDYPAAREALASLAA